MAAKPPDAVLASGLEGTGKTDGPCTLGHRPVEAGHSVLFTPAYRLVQDRRRQARLRPAQAIAQAGQLRLLLLSALGYMPQGTEESEALFTPVAGSPLFNSVFNQPHVAIQTM